MARPRTPIGTFGEIYFEKAPGGRARAFAHHIEVLELPPDVDGVDVGICRAAGYFEQRAKLLRVFTQQPTERIGVESLLSCPRLRPEQVMLERIE